MVKVKVCGITSLKDAEKAVELGADALGFNFYPKSPRFITKVSAKDIIRLLPPFVTPVGIFVNETMDKIMEFMYFTGVRVLQLHGEETPEFCMRMSRPVIKAVRVAGPESLQGLPRYPVIAFLLDSATEGYGGSGQTFDWNLAVEAKKFGKIILSGGLTPENVVEAIEKVRPYAVDVCSGVETAPGRKDHTRLKEFMEAVKNK